MKKTYFLSTFLSFFFSRKTASTKMSTDSFNDAGTTSARRTGIVKSFHARKGWGIIEDLDSNEQYFVHHSELRPQNDSPLLPNWKHSLYTGEYVEYSIGVNPKKPTNICARDVTGIRGGPLLCDFGAWRILFYRKQQALATSTAVTQTQSEERSEENEQNFFEQKRTESLLIPNDNTDEHDVSRT